jgi:LPXTG-motif cell wall-anchored protein
MDSNPVILPLIMIGTVVAGSVAAWNAVAQRGAASDAERQQAAQAAAAQDLASRIQQQAAISQLSTAVMVGVPVMVGLGAFLLWKKRQQEAA